MPYDSAVLYLKNILKRTFPFFLSSLTEQESQDLFLLLVRQKTDSVEIEQKYAEYRNNLSLLMSKKYGSKESEFSEKELSFLSREILIELIPIDYIVNFIKVLNVDEIKKIFPTRERLYEKIDLLKLSPNHLIEVYNHFGKKLISYYKLTTVPLTCRGPEMFEEIWKKINPELKSIISISYESFFVSGFEGKTIIYLQRFKHELVDFDKILDAFLYPGGYFHLKKYLPQNQDIISFLDIIGCEKLLNYINKGYTSALFGRLIRLIKFFPTSESKYGFIKSCNSNELKNIVGFNLINLKKLLELFSTQEEKTAILGLYDHDELKEFVDDKIYNLKNILKLFHNQENKNIFIKSYNVNELKKMVDNNFYNLIDLLELLLPEDQEMLVGSYEPKFLKEFVSNNIERLKKLLSFFSIQKNQDTYINIFYPEELKKLIGTKFYNFISLVELLCTEEGKVRFLYSYKIEELKKLIGDSVYHLKCSMGLFSNTENKKLIFNMYEFNEFKKMVNDSIYNLHSLLELFPSEKSKIEFMQCYSLKELEKMIGDDSYNLKQLIKLLPTEKSKNEFLKSYCPQLKKSASLSACAAYVTLDSPIIWSKKSRNKKIRPGITISALSCSF